MVLRSLTALIAHLPCNVRFMFCPPDLDLTHSHLMVACIITASNNWTATQILTPILVAIVLSVTFILYLQYKKGRLSRLKSILFMRGSRQVPSRRPRGWTIDTIHSVDSGFPDAEATPMINTPLRWTSLSPHDATDRHRLSPRIREGMMTLSTAIRSIQRMFGRGPIPVSHVPISEAFDIEDSDPETDPFATLRSSASSRARRNETPTAGRSTSSNTDREAFPRSLSQPSVATWDSAILGSELDDAANLTGDSGVDDHDSEAVTRDGVMLISRNGQDFSSTSSVISIRIGGTPVETDRSSIEVGPPSPALNNQVSRSPRMMARM
jgi:hypothetical protein